MTVKLARYRATPETAEKEVGAKLGLSQAFIVCLEEFSRDWITEKTVSTKEGYVRDVISFVEFQSQGKDWSISTLENIAEINICENSLWAYLTRLEQRNLAPKTHQRRAVSILTFWDFLFATNRIANSIPVRFKRKFLGVIKRKIAASSTLFLKENDYQLLKQEVCDALEKIW